MRKHHVGLSAIAGFLVGITKNVYFSEISTKTQLRILKMENATALKYTREKYMRYTYRWSCRLKAFEHLLHVYLRSSLCVSLCLANALELLNSLLQTGQRMIDLPPALSMEDLGGLADGRSPPCLDKYLEPRAVDIDRRILNDSVVERRTSTSLTDISSATVQQPISVFAILHRTQMK